MIRITRIGIGLGLILLGLFLLVLPGPGLLTIASGLAVLAPEYTWARRLLDGMKSHFRRYLTRGDATAIAPLPGSAGTPPNGPEALGGESTAGD